MVSGDSTSLEGLRCSLPTKRSLSMLEAFSRSASRGLCSSLVFTPLFFCTRSLSCFKDRPVAPTLQQWTRLLQLIGLNQNLQLRHFVLFAIGIGDPAVECERGQPLPGQVIDLVYECLQRDRNRCVLALARGFA
jgi:hypothetical protein